MTLCLLGVFFENNFWFDTVQSEHENFALWLMMAHRLWRRPNIKPASGGRFLAAQ